MSDAGAAVPMLAQLSESLREAIDEVWAAHGCRNDSCGELHTDRAVVHLVTAAERLLANLEGLEAVVGARPPAPQCESRDDIRAALIIQVLARWNIWKRSLPTGAFSHSDGLKFVQSLDDLLAEDIPAARPPASEKGTG